MTGLDSEVCTRCASNRYWSHIQLYATQTNQATQTDSCIAHASTQTRKTGARVEDPHRPTLYKHFSQPFPVQQRPGV